MATSKVKTATKRILIDNANTKIVTVTAVAAFLTVFSLVAAKSLFSQASYQNRVINAQRKADDQVKADLSATSNLVTAYNAFINQPENIIQGNPKSTTNSNDGSSAKIVLDALPSTYDFPALATSLNNMLSSQGVTIDSINGNDQAQPTTSTGNNSTNPKPIPIPFGFTVTGNYQQIQGLLDEFDKSIRPMQIQTISISGNSQSLNVIVSAQTFYQPEETLATTTETIK